MRRDISTVGTLRTGSYDLRANADGTWSEWEHNVLVRPGKSTNVTLRLKFKAPPAPAWRRIERHDARVGRAGAGIGAARFGGRSQGQYLVHAAGDGTLARFNPDTHEWKLFKVPTEDSGPHGLVSDALGDIWFTENYAGKIGRLDPASGAIAEFTPPTAKDPHTPVFGADGALWFTAQNSNLIGRLDIETKKITEYGVPTQNAHPYGMASADDGALWFCELTGGKLGRIDPRTGAMTEYAPSEHDVAPRRLVAVKGAIYFTDSGGGRLGRFTLADKTFKFWESPSGNHSEPYGIGADTTGKIWYEESGGNANNLIRFDPAVEVFRTYSMPAANSSVRNMARDAKGRLWMPLSLANKIAVVE